LVLGLSRFRWLDFIWCC